MSQRESRVVAGARAGLVGVRAILREGLYIGSMAEEPRMTVFGAVVGELMLERDIRSWTDLSKLLKAHGHNFEASRLSGWAYGQHDADWRFVRALAEVLRLEAEERTRLAMTFAYGQAERVNESYLSVRKEPTIKE